MVVFVQVLGEIEERNRRLDNAPPPPTVSFVEPPPPQQSQPSAPAFNVKAAYQKMKSPAPVISECPSIDDEGIQASVPIEAAANLSGKPRKQIIEPQ